MEWIKRIKVLAFPSEDKAAFDLKEAIVNHDLEKLRIHKVEEEVKE